MWKSQFCSRCLVAKFLFSFFLFMQTAHGLRPRNLTREERDSAILKFRIIPDIIKKLPEHHIHVEFLKEYIPMYGNRLEAHKLVHAPVKIRWPFSFRKYYTLIMIDPDVPSARNPKKRAHLQWLVVNIKANWVLIAQELAKYVRADPGEGTGFHRIVFFVFEQPNGIMKFSETNYNNAKDSDCRFHFSVENFVRKYNLSDPHAVNFFITRWKLIPTTRAHLIQ
ncbi:unnamed protein product [Bemisia tabaci]|uniref:Phosphatidylethanolamine-binding protein n=1 Tax=Bemisia tabaci TaxID=7038 RepID=A0A9P0A142_BEMTA|nr:unnamed protein product [Bemisia tabaci]